MLYGRPFVFRFTFLKVARKFAPPANLPGKGPAEEVGSVTFIAVKKFSKRLTHLVQGGPVDEGSLSGTNGGKNGKAACIFAISTLLFTGSVSSPELSLIWRFAN
jgi:hypothetical protein